MTDSAPDRLTDLFAANRAGVAAGVTSVCCAHPAVIRAALSLARDRGQVAVIESTCNQVNQDGGYTGLTPDRFAAQVRQLATETGLHPGDLVLGGDHLGPQPWRSLRADEAMAKAEAMVRAYAAAGYTKIHLDCSMACAGDPDALSDDAVATRAASLAAAAEAAVPAGAARPVYIIGTEVPAPGGMGEGHAIVPTDPASVRETWAAHRRAFTTAGLDDAFDRVVAIVVQPGLDFGNEEVVHFDPAGATRLADAVLALDGAVYEAHSTDYQLPDSYARLVAMHFAILKVGPAATFAFREGVYALQAAARELPGWSQAADVRSALDAAMLRDPRHWRSHYAGGDAREAYLRHFSFSDRIRYYWTDPAVEDAVATLMAQVGQEPLPLPLVSQYFPQHVAAVAAGTLTPNGEQLIEATVQRALAPYADACGDHARRGGS